MRTSVVSVALFVLASLPFQAHAVFECNVSVKNVLVYADGMVNVLHSGRGDYTMICNMQSEYGGVSPSTCAMWATMLQVIKKKNGIANFYYQGAGACSTLATYGSAPVPTYIGDVTP